jgi:putative transposase
VRHVQEAHAVSERRSCAALGVDRSTIRSRSTKADQAALRLRIRDLAKARVRYGYYRIYILLRREGWMINHKRVHRLYREDGLSLRLKRPRRHVSAANRERQPAAREPNELWSMDFVSDALFDGRRLRALTVVDAFTREALAIEVDQGIKGEQVVAAVTQLASQRGAPRVIRVDNGPEFLSKALDRWAYENAVTLDFSRPGKPTDNALVESFNGRLRDECLNAHWFLSLTDARSKIEAWRRHYKRAVLTQPWDGEHPRSSPWRWSKRPPNEARKLTFRPDQKTGDRQPNPELTFHPDHPMGADQSAVRPCFFPLSSRCPA